MPPKSTICLRAKPELDKLDPEFVWPSYSSGLARYRKRLQDALSANLPHTYVGLEYSIDEMAFFIKFETIARFGGVFSQVSCTVLWHHNADPKDEMKRVKALHDTWILALSTIEKKSTTKEES